MSWSPIGVTTQPGHTAFEHDRDRLPQQQQRRRQVHVDRALPVDVAHLDDRPWPVDARVGHDHVETAERFDRRPDDLAGVRRIGGIAGDGESSDLLGDRVEEIGSAPRHDDPGTFRRESSGDRSADAGASTRDDRNPSGQLLHHGEP